jgi:photosystem II stability/assembly factor-like uncharacterized protein
VDWVSRPSGVTRDLNAVTFVDGRFFAGGRSGTMIQSSDGDGWTNVAIPTVHDVDAIGFGTTTNHPLGLLVVTVSTNLSPLGSRRTRIITSTNAVDWETDTYIQTGGGGSYRSIVSGNARFLMGGPWNPGEQLNCAITSSEGEAWFQAGSCVTGPVAFGNGIFLLAGNFQGTSNGLILDTLTSTDAAFWLPLGSTVPGLQALPGTLRALALCFGGSKFVAVADQGTIASSPDGTNWTVARTDTDAMLNSVTYGDGLYVTVGRGGIILSSADAVNWTHRNVRSGRRLFDVAPDGDGFVAVGSAGTLARSTNGIHWEELRAPTTNTLWGVHRPQMHYLIVGNGGTILTGDSLTNLALQASGTTAELRSAASGSGLFIVVGSGGIVLSSSDLTNWFPQNSGTLGFLADVIFSQGKFVAVGAGGTVIVSSDGTNWFGRNSGTTKLLTKIVYGRGRFVAACFSTVNGLLAITSADGLVWEPALTSIQSAPGVVAYGNGIFLVKSGSGFPGFHVSRDGRNWTEYMVRTNFPGADDFAFNNGTFVGVGFFGLVWQSDPVIGLELIHNGSAQLTVLGPKNSTYRIEGTDNLSDTNSWQELTTISTAPYSWTDPDSTTRPHQVYRAVLLPWPKLRHAP